MLVARHGGSPPRWSRHHSPASYNNRKKDASRSGSYRSAPLGDRHQESRPSRDFAADPSRRCRRDETSSKTGEAADLMARILCQEGARERLYPA